MEKVWTEDGQRESVPPGILPVHHGDRLPSPQAGNDHLHWFLSFLSEEEDKKYLLFFGVSSTLKVTLEHVLSLCA